MKKTLLFLAIPLVLGVGYCLVFRCFQFAKEGSTLRYASGPTIIEAPIHAAFHKNFFKNENIELDLAIYPDGKTSLSKLLIGEVDVAGVMATPIVYESFKRNDFRIIAVLEHPKFHHLLVNKKIASKPEDLKGQSIGVTKGTSGEYLMYSYLISNQIGTEEVDVIELTGPQLVKAMLSGDICAMFSWDPYIAEVERALNDSTMLLDHQQLVPPSWVFVASEDFVLRNPALTVDFLKAVKEGVDYANNHPRELLEINAFVTGRDNSNISPADVSGRFQLHLKQKLMLDLEAQARWLIAEQDTMRLNVPNYLGFIYPDAMREVSPEAVTLIK